MNKNTIFSWKVSLSHEQPYIIQPIINIEEQIETLLLEDTEFKQANNIINRIKNNENTPRT